MFCRALFFCLIISDTDAFRVPFKVSSSIKFRQETIVASVPSELPSSFEDAIGTSVVSTLEALEDGWNGIRIDYDAASGDETYTTLKKAIPFSQKFILGMSGSILERFPTKTIRIYFPDVGSAAFYSQSWKDLPARVKIGYLSRDLPIADDCAVVLICPGQTELEATQKVFESAEQLNIPFIIINPEFGFAGVLSAAGRYLRDRLSTSLVVSFYLRTQEWGAIVRTYPKAYTAWEADERAPGGYSLLTTSERPILKDDVNEIIAKRDGEEGPPIADAFMKFVREFGRM